MGKAFLWLISLSLLVILGVGGWLYLYVSVPVADHQDQVVVVIPKGAGVRQIKTILGEKGVIRDDIRFLILAQLNGLARSLRAGEYLIRRDLRPLEVLRLLASGEVRRHRLTIAEGLTVRQIAEIFAADGWVDRERFLQQANSPQLLSSLGIQGDTLEGYLFPETYTLVRGEIDEDKLIALMIGRFEQVWREVAEQEQTNLTRHEVVTLASIVEKETGVAVERPLIARVFFNRLELGMKLQSDPTVIYGIKDFQGNITRADLLSPTPYNTYVIKGLPPGPICNPGRASLEAVLRPAVSKSLYFVSKNDGSHYFSRNLREHNLAVRKYQLKK